MAMVYGKTASLIYVIPLTIDCLTMDAYFQLPAVTIYVIPLYTLYIQHRRYRYVCKSPCSNDCS